jgi:hypothetical protein
MAFAPNQLSNTVARTVRRATPAPTTGATTTSPGAPTSTTPTLTHGDRIQCPQVGADVLQVIDQKLQQAISDAAVAVANIQRVNSASDPATAEALWQRHRFEEWYGPYSKKVARRVENRLSIVTGTLSDPSVKIVCRMKSIRCRTAKDSQGNRSEIYGHTIPGTNEITLCGKWFNEHDPTKTFASAADLGTSIYEQLNTIPHEGAHIWAGSPDSKVKGEEMYGVEQSRWLARNRQGKAVRNADNTGYFLAGSDPNSGLPAATATPAPGAPDFLHCGADSQAIHDARLDVKEAMRKANATLGEVSLRDYLQQHDFWNQAGASRLATSDISILRMVVRLGFHSLDRALIKCDDPSDTKKRKTGVIQFERGRRWMVVTPAAATAHADRMREMAEASFRLHMSDSNDAKDLAKVVVP